MENLQDQIQYFVPETARETQVERFFLRVDTAQCLPVDPSALLQLMPEEKGSADRSKSIQEHQVLEIVALY